MKQNHEFDPIKYYQKVLNYWSDERIKKLKLEKNLLLLPTNAPVLLYRLGIMNSDASISANSMRKFLQINHLVQMLKNDLEDCVNRHKKVNLVDLCCGKGYTSFILCWLFKEHWKKDFSLIGIDSDSKRINFCEKTAQELGLSTQTTFRAMKIADFTITDKVHFTIALHACDTATDEALRFVLTNEVEYFAIAPCCHAEISRQWKELANTDHPLKSMFASPLMRRQMAADFTDLLRIELLRGCGYEVTAKEFTHFEHTPKNRLIFGIKRGLYLKEKLRSYQELKNYIHVPTFALEQFLPERIRGNFSKCAEMLGG